MGYFILKGDGLKFCKFLMERGVDVNFIGGWMYFLFYIVVEYGFVEFVKFLLSKDDINVDIFWEEYGIFLSVVIFYEYEMVVGIFF